MRKSRAADTSQSQRPGAKTRTRPADVKLVEDFLAKVADQEYRHSLRQDKRQIERIIDAAIERDMPFVVHLLAAELDIPTPPLLQKEHPPTSSSAAADSSKTLPVDTRSAKLEKVLAAGDTHTLVTGLDQYWTDPPPPSHEDLRLLLRAALVLAEHQDDTLGTARTTLDRLAARYESNMTVAPSESRARADVVRNVASLALRFEVLDIAVRAMQVLFTQTSAPSTADLELLARTVSLGSDRLDAAILPDHRSAALEQLRPVLFDIWPAWLDKINATLRETVVRPMLDHVDAVLVRHSENEYRTRLFDTWNALIQWTPQSGSLDLLRYTSGIADAAPETAAPIRPHLLARLAGDTYRQCIKGWPAQFKQWRSHECSEWLDLLASSRAASPLTIATARQFYFLFRKYSDKRAMREPFVARGRTVLNLIRRSTARDAKASKMGLRILNDYLASIVSTYPRRDDGSVELSHWHLSIVAQAYIHLRDFASVVQVYERLLRQRMVPNKGDLQVFLRAAAQRDLDMLARLLDMTRKLGIVHDLDSLLPVISAIASRERDFQSLSRELYRIVELVDELDIVSPATLKQLRREIASFLNKRRAFHAIAINNPSELFTDAKESLREQQGRPAKLVRPDRERMSRFLDTALAAREWRVATSLFRYALDSKLWDGMLLETTLDCYRQCIIRQPALRAASEFSSSIEEVLCAALALPDDLFYRRKTLNLALQLAQDCQLSDVERQLQKQANARQME